MNVSALDFQVVNSRPVVVTRRARPSLWLCFLVVGWLFSGGTRQHAADCNGNGIDDGVEIDGETAADCNANGLPDACEETPPPLGTIEEIPAPSASLPAIADFDGDGRLDIAAGTVVDDVAGVSLFLADETPAFTAAEERLPTLRRIESTVAGDLDGDGSQDVVILDAGGVRAYFNRPPEGFSDRFTVTTQDDMHTIATADMDGSGTDDVVASHRGAGVVAVFLSTGDGSFERLADTSVESAGELVLGDVDGDEDVDVVVTMAGGVAVLHNAGDGELASAATIDSPGDPSRLPLLRNIDGDPLPDVAFATDSGIMVFRNRGGEPFELMATYVMDPEVRQATALAAGDVDRDGDIDLVVGHSRAGAAAGLVFLLQEDPTTLHATTSFDVGSSARNVKIEDMDGDGDDDLILVTDSRQSVNVVWNDAGEFPPLSTLDLFLEWIPLSERFEPHTSWLNDLDGDGDLDISTMDGEDQVMVLANDGQGRFEEFGRYRLDGTSEIISTVAVDLDRDGDIDIAVVDELLNHLAWMRNEGDATFIQAEEIYATGQTPAFLAAGDLDGDLFPDLISVNSRSDTLGIFINLADGTFAPEMPLDVGDRPRSVAVLDVEGDSDLDLVVANNAGGTFWVLVNDGNGSFEESGVVETGSPRYVTTADLDGDGDGDLIMAHDGQRELSLFLNDGSGGFTFWRSVPAGGRPNSVITCDIDRDARVDLVAANEQDDTISVILSRDFGAYAPPTVFPVGADPRFAMAGDVDGDGDVDLFSANHSTYDFSLFRNQGPREAPVTHRERICTELDFFELTVATGHEPGVDRWTRFLLPIAPSAFPTIFENVRLHESAAEFLRSVFPARFGELTDEAYEQLVGRRATREFYAGRLVRLRSHARLAYGFNLQVGDPSDSTERFSEEEVADVHARLEAALDLDPVVYSPDAGAAREDAAAWTESNLRVITAFYRRGDVSGDGLVDLGDAMRVFDLLFREGPAPTCESAADTNDDGETDISDGVTLLLYLFGGLGTLQEPAETCGWDPTPDRLSCSTFPPCAE